MSGLNTFGGTIKLEGEKEYRKAISQINSDLRQDRTNSNKKEEREEAPLKRSKMAGILVLTCLKRRQNRLISQNAC